MDLWSADLRWSASTLPIFINPFSECTAPSGFPPRTPHWDWCAHDLPPKKPSSKPKEISMTSLSWLYFLKFSWKLPLECELYTFGFCVFMPRGGYARTKCECFRTEQLKTWCVGETLFRVLLFSVNIALVTYSWAPATALSLSPPVCAEWPPHPLTRVLPEPPSWFGRFYKLLP